MPARPFGNERQDRMHTQQYAKYRRSYWHVERMHAELAEVYGYTPTPRLRSNARHKPLSTIDELREGGEMSDRIHDPADVAEIEQQCKQARPHDELICELLDSRRPKTEREHAAAREIERLRDLCAERDDYRRRWSDAESNLAFCDSDLQTLEIELAAQRKRIEDAPVSYARPVYTMFRGDPGKEVEHTVIATAALPREWAGRKLALVVLEDK